MSFTLLRSILSTSQHSSRTVLSKHTTQVLKQSLRWQKAFAPKDVPEGPSAIKFSRLLKPFFFTICGSGVSFGIASIWQYESLRSKVQSAKVWGHFYIPREEKAGQFRNKMSNWWHNLAKGEQVAVGIIAINVAVFVCWRVPQLEYVMKRYFLSSPANKALCWPMLFSTFSHVNAIHLATNMYVLWSFSATASNLLGPEQFTATYISAGLVSSFFSYLFKIARVSSTPSLGASGAILGLLGLVCSHYPDARLSVAFVDTIYPHSFSADTAMKCMLLFDTCGCIFGWGFFDHAAHLGGLLYGIWYERYGNQLIWKKREQFIKYYHDQRGKP